jgi:hypothetical protein
MRKLIVLILILSAGFTLQAQKLSGTQEYSNPQEFGGSKYSIVNWNVNYQILFEQDSYYIKLSYPNVSVSPSSLYGTPNKFYSKSDLGISTWPHTDPTPYNFSLELTLIYPDGSYHKTGASINENSFIESNSKFKNAGVGSFKVASVEKMNYNGAHDQKIDELIAAKKNGVSKTSKNTSNGETSNNNPLTQTGTTNNGKATNTAGNDPLAHFETDPTTPSNPMTNNTKSSSSAVESFNKGYQQGQQITDAVMPVANELVDAWNRKVERNNAGILADREEHSRRENLYRDYCTETNKTLSDWQYYSKNVLQKIPLLLNNTSPSWESILGSEKLPIAFGKNAQFIKENFNSYTVGDRLVLKRLEQGYLKFMNTPTSFFDFYAATVQVDYKYNYFMDGVNISKTHHHSCEFIYNEDDIVIGILIDIDTYYMGDAVPIQSYFRDILSKIGPNYVMLDANTFLLKDKLIYFEYDQIQMYDLNYLNDHIWIKWPMQYLNVEFLSKGKAKPKVVGIGFNTDSAKSGALSPGLEKVKKTIYNPSGQAPFLEKNFSKYILNEKGIILKQVLKDNKAEKAGLQANDIISVANGIPVTSPYIFQLIVAGYTEEGKLNLTYLRDGIEYKTIINF